MVAAACMEASGPQLAIPDRLENVTAEPLTGEPGFALAEPVRVRVVDTQGNGVPGERVQFTVLTGGGSVTPAETLTDADGIASAEWRLGSTPGPQTLRATYQSKAVVLTATAVEGRGAAIARVSGGQATSLLPAGCQVGEPLVVRVTDGQGQPVAGASVGFESVRGGATADPAVATTDAAGLARTVWRTGFEGGENVLRAVLRTASQPSVTVTAQSAAAAPNGYSVIGNKVYDPATCQPIVFRGVTRPSLQWHYAGDERFAQVGTDWQIIRSWGANVVRLPVSQTYWVPGTRQHDPGYKARVIDAVTKARALGLAVIIDLHASDRGDLQYATTPDGQQMPDVNISLPFWKDVAATFRNDGGVLFELYNEPHDIGADVWLNGGQIPAGPSYVGDTASRSAFQAVGMQQLYDAIRAEGARNLVIVGGLHWGYYLDHVPTSGVRGYNIVYSAHPYDWPDKQPPVWEKDFGFLAATHPVIIGEFGAYECNRLQYYRDVLDYADRKGMGWIAWAWWTPPPVGVDGRTAEDRAREICRFPALITDWNGTPSASGAVIRERLARGN